MSSAIRVPTSVKKWQGAGIRKAMASLERGHAIPHQKVKDWVASWDGPEELPRPKRSAK